MLGDSYDGRTPYIYQGEEIGDKSCLHRSIRDVESINAYHILKNKGNLSRNYEILQQNQGQCATIDAMVERDKCRFYHGTPWIEVASNYDKLM